MFILEDQGGSLVRPQVENRGHSKRDEKVDQKTSEVKGVSGGQNRTIDQGDCKPGQDPVE